MQKDGSSYAGFIWLGIEGYRHAGKRKTPTLSVYFGVPPVFLRNQLNQAFKLIKM
jgi:hypothetical protein